MKRNILLVFLLFFLWQFTSAKEETISRNFSAKTLNTLHIENKYGEVKVENWDKQEISIRVNIWVESNKTLTEERIFNNINIDFREEGETLVAKTEFGRFFSFMRMSNSLLRSGELHIDYLVKVPVTLNLEIALKNGNIILYKRDGNVKVELQDGVLTTQELYGTNSMMLKGANAKITTVNNLKLHMRNGSVSINKINELIADTYSVEMKLNEVGVLNAESIRDKIKISKIKGTVSFVSNMSALKVDSLLSDGFFSSDYGSLYINKLGEKFDKVKIAGKGADLFVDIKDTTTRIAVNHHQSTDLDIASRFKMNMSFGENNKNFISTGKSGEGTTNNQLLINCKGGKLVLR